MRYMEISVPATTGLRRGLGESWKSFIRYLASYTCAAPAR